MKTCVDISAFLKRATAANANTAASLTVAFDGKVFVVKCGDDSARSTYLDDALENLAEASRRRANGMQAVRETAPESRTVTVPATVTQPTTVTSSSQAFAAAIRKIYGATIPATAPAPQHQACFTCKGRGTVNVPVVNARVVCHYCNGTGKNP